MCPACMTTAALLIVGSTTAGGLTAMIAGKLRAGSGKRKSFTSNATNKGERHEKP